MADRLVLVVAGERQLDALTPVTVGGERAVSGLAVRMGGWVDGRCRHHGRHVDVQPAVGECRQVGGGRLRSVESEAPVPGCRQRRDEPLEPGIDPVGSGHVIDQEEVAPIERRIRRAADDEVIPAVLDCRAGTLEKREIRAEAEGADVHGSSLLVATTGSMRVVKDACGQTRVTGVGGR